MQVMSYWYNIDDILIQISGVFLMCILSLWENALIEKLSSKLRIKCKISHELYKIKIIDNIKTLGAYYAI